MRTLQSLGVLCLYLAASTVMADNDFTLQGRIDSATYQFHFAVNEADTLRVGITTSDTKHPGVEQLVHMLDGLAQVTTQVSSETALPVINERIILESSHSDQDAYVAITLEDNYRLRFYQDRIEIATASPEQTYALFDFFSKTAFVVDWVHEPLPIQETTRASLFAPDTPVARNDPHSDSSGEPTE